MDSLSGLLAFVRSAELNSFVAASERLGVSASAISKSVSRLEGELGVRLFHRSTRRLSLTEEGSLFLQRGQRIVEEIEEAESELSRLAGAPRGKLRVSVPAIGYRILMPFLPDFAARYPTCQRMTQQLPSVFIYNKWAPLLEYTDDHQFTPRRRDHA
ncbi:LysR family transcriptional regulator [Dyella sp. KRB-257]|uniref:LysR family transcriptional regulator n=1 Tax=Dyella sp. KRB-257 TaxID=3400915 RepID=UPI003C035A3B